jgi:alanine dehydrogenase
MVGRMKKGSVIVDVAAQPGRAVETVDRLTTLDAPCWQVNGVTHCAVPNLPGAVPRAASQALSKALLPYYVLQIARKGLLSAMKADAGLARAAILPRVAPKH